MSFVRTDEGWPRGREADALVLRHDVRVTTTDSKCTFTADAIVRNGKGWLRIPSVRCMGDAGHERGLLDVEHEFLAGGEHMFGATWEKGRWVTRR